MFFHPDNPSVPPVSSRPIDKSVSITQLLFSFKGRINRRTGWVFFLSYYIFFISLFFLADIGYLDPLRGIARNNIVAFVVLAVILVSFCAYIQIPVVVKRLHDTNRSGWNVLWYMIPTILSGWFSYSFSSLSRLLWFIGFLYLLIVCGIFKGNPEPNKYGNPVK